MHGCICCYCCICRLPPLQGVTGFLPKKEAYAAGRALAPGSLLEVVVAAGAKPVGGSSTTAIPVVCAPEAVAGAVAREWDGLNIGSLLPGQLVTARVRNLLSDGLLCSFLTYFRWVGGWVGVLAWPGCCSAVNC